MALHESRLGPVEAEIEIASPFDLADWDEQVAALPGAGFFHSTGWARVLLDTYGYQPMYLLRREVGRLHSLLALMEVNSWLSGRRGVSLPFADAVAPLCPDIGSFRLLYGKAQEIMVARQWKYLECRGGKEWLGDAPAATSYFNHTMDLTGGETALVANLDDSVRRALRKAERSNLEVEFSQTPVAVREFYRLLCKTRQRHGLPPQPFAFFANFQRHVLGPGKGWIVIARQQGVPVAGAVFVRFGQTVSYKFGASDGQYQQLRPNNLVMWRAIQRCIGDGVSHFDFGRTSLDNEGLRRFKLSWGSREEQICYFRYDRKSGSYAQSRDDSSGWHNKVFRALPVSISQMIGTVLYRHMG